MRTRVGKLITIILCLSLTIAVIVSERFNKSSEAKLEEVMSLQKESYLKSQEFYQNINLDNDDGSVKDEKLINMEEFLKQYYEKNPEEWYQYPINGLEYLDLSVYHDLNISEAIRDYIKARYGLKEKITKVIIQDNVKVNESHVFFALTIYEASGKNGYAVVVVDLATLELTFQTVE